jgi:hypothetical protein
MNSSQFYVKLVLAVACLGLSILVINQGQSSINLVKAAREASENKVTQEPPKTEPPAEQLAQPGDKAAALMSELQEKQAGLDKLLDDFQKRKDEIQKETRDKQTKINAANQYAQVLYRMVQEIKTVNSTAKDEKLDDLLPKDGIQFAQPLHDNPFPSPAP